jgi:cytosine/adenosine deaminase-related metal-dependent hydrolase
MGGSNGSHTVLAGGAVVTVDRDRRVLDPGAVAVRGDRIVAVDERGTIREAYPDAEEIDLRGTVLLPGLVDSHGHAGHGMTKGLADGTGEWLDVVEEIYFRASDEAFWRAESYLSAVERLEFGVTTSLSYTGSMPRVDDPKYAEAAATGYAELGLRHVVNVGPPSPPYPHVFRDVDADATVEVDLDRAFETTASVIDRLDGTADGRVSVFVGPSELAPEAEDGRASSYDVEQMQRTRELADEADTNVQAHAYGGQVLAAADAVPELLDADLSLAHCAGVTEREIELMAASGVGASHGPMTNAYARARFPVIEALDAGVTVAVSTDGSAPDRSFDLLPMGRIAAQLQRVHFEDPSLVPAGKTIETMTIDAAEVLGMADEIGSLEPGKKADVIALDVETARMQPRALLPQRVAYVGSGLDVTFVMVDGAVLGRDGRFRGYDLDEVLADANRAFEATIDRADAREHVREHPNTWRSARY